MYNTATYNPVAASGTGFAANVTGGTWTLTNNSAGDNLAHQVTITNDTANDHSAKTAVLVGTDADGKTLTETLALPGASATVTSVNYFLTLTSVTPSASIGADTMDIGFDDPGTTPTYPVNYRQNPFNLSVAVIVVSGTINYSLEYTFDNPFTDSQTATWIDDATMDDETTTSVALLQLNVRAVRIQVNSTTGATIRVIYVQGDPNV